jgi:cytochrome c peroxidase
VTTLALTAQAAVADAVRHYEKGGIDRPSRSPVMVPIRLSDQERLDLVAFMESLTGEAARPDR